MTALQTREPRLDAGTAPAPTASCALLRMAVGDEIVAIGIEAVREILQLTRMTPLPRTPDFIRGVMNLRGAVVPVLDLAAWLGRLPAGLGKRSCIVVVDVDPEAENGEAADQSPQATHGSTETWTIGLLVDAVFEVFERPASAIEPAPALGTRIAPQALRGITRNDGQLIGVLALPRLLALRELASRIAGFEAPAGSRRAPA